MNASSSTSTADDDIQATLENALQRIDPFIRFLTKATGKASVPFKSLVSVLPNANNAASRTTSSSNNDNRNGELQNLLIELAMRGVLNYNMTDETIGFPLPPSSSSSSSNVSSNTPSSSSILFQPPAKLIGKGLHGSSDTAAKRRMKVLSWTLKQNSTWVSRSKEVVSNSNNTDGSGECNERVIASASTLSKSNNVAEKNQQLKYGAEQNGENCSKLDAAECITDYNNANHDEEEEGECSEERKAAYQALHDLLTGNKNDEEVVDNTADNDEKSSSKRAWLPSQPALAGSHPSRPAKYGTLRKSTIDNIPASVSQLFGFDLSPDTDNDDDDDKSVNMSFATVETTQTQRSKRLFQHQVDAIDAAMSGIHTCLCTGTGSGKSLCFLLPVLAKAVTSVADATSILIFPTKALAQDQYSKLEAMLSKSNNCHVRVGVIDGDTPHPQRDVIATECQIVLTNPDTLHANIIPGWKKPSYKSFLSRLRTVVVDEAHIYDGCFGAHVSLVLRRLSRVCRVASENEIDNKLSFIACSATLTRPEEHFRMLCPLGNDDVRIVTEDGSPCGSKHFFVWNPPILDVNGNSTESVFPPKNLSPEQIEQMMVVADNNEDCDINVGTKKRKKKRNYSSSGDNCQSTSQLSNLFIRRRHAADETAALLAKAIRAQTRTIAFAGTRCLVEWIYEKTLTILKSDPDTSHLADKVESYRGGYTAEVRRSIESRLFRRDLLAVVGTNALELGVDIGGVDLTLHCGYPGSQNSLLQQSGRAGRGKGQLRPSCAIMITFSAASDQFVWRKPSSLLSRGIDAPPTSISEAVMSGHILCAADEFPLTGTLPITCLLNDTDATFASDETIMGEGYQDTVEFLFQKGLLSKKKVKTMKDGAVTTITVYNTHPVVKTPWKRVSLRSIEPLNYSIVDLSHPLQSNRTDKIHDKAAVLDTIPYSRVFYHAFPGAIIKHRGRKYRIEAMESPPAFVGGQSFGRESSDLAAFARPTHVQYTTQALSINEITVVKQTRHAELVDSRACQSVSVSGSGLVTVKRSVHGYKCLSHVNRKEISRSTLNLPPMEYDTYAIWLDADAVSLKGVVTNFNEGVHALNHALVAVAPLIVPCSSSDIDCDHSTFDCTRILLFDVRAGGSGICKQLYNKFYQCLEAAVELLQDCTTCYSETSRYSGGCPGKCGKSLLSSS
jgi:DEAD/DEAH box helicase domain-containing protein